MAECFKTMFQGQMKLLDLGLINQAQEVCDMVNRREESEDKKSGKMNQDEESSLDIKLKDYIEEELRKHEVKHKMKLGLFKGEVGNRTVETLRKEYVKKMWERGKDPTCGRCGATTRKILRQKTGFVYEGLKRDEYMENVDEFDEFRTQSKRQSRGEQRAERIEINPQELLDHFRVLYLHDKEMLDNLFPVFTQTKLKTPTDLLFIQVFINLFLA
ncbi:uncharacterized protein LOC111716919 [Eurytemora carolleeae]|uniref:uncharacterized protein LOC111716919 n=1 Tax=Eurytemora carolleeae TaxID=1294199 RepID=UPI000C7873F4|nr:uncharacterized protein LOC111716919 [Eurytemora carolleeae]|eukprot:XP_023348196.1 uncharacterized protein LOC111716919 [Eurytemora affinis]